MEISIKDCSPPAVGGAVAVEALTTELQSDGVLRVATDEVHETEGQLSISMMCGASTDARVVLTRRATGKTATVTVGLDDVPRELRPRVLALATSELVRGYWSILVDRDARVDLIDGDPEDEDPSSGTFPDLPISVPPTLVLPSLPPPPSLSAGARTSRLLPATAPHASTANAGRRSSSWVGLDAKVRVFLNRPSLYYGGGVDLGVGPWMLGVEGLGNEKSDALGRVSSGLVSFRAGYTFELKANRRWAWRLGPRGGIGVAWASGADALNVAGRDAVGMYADVATRTELRLRTGQIQTVVGVEGGVARGLAARASERTVSASGGWFVGLSVGIRYEPPLGF